jgi:hypothetical protein
MWCVIREQSRTTTARYVTTRQTGGNPLRRRGPESLVDPSFPANIRSLARVLRHQQPSARQRAERAQELFERDVAGEKRAGHRERGEDQVFDDMFFIRLLAKIDL